jgi:Transposase DDE domain group 1
LVAVAAYGLFQVLQLSARATAVGAAQVWILRERLLKVAVWVERSVRRMVLHLPQAWPWREAWREVAQTLTVT